MEENIFKGAKFGDKFLLRNGQYGILLSLTDLAVLAIEVNNSPYIESLNLEYDLRPNINNEHTPNQYDIISRYQEPTDEKKLDELAECFVDSFGCQTSKDGEECYKAGYRKAKEV